MPEFCRISAVPTGGIMDSDSVNLGSNPSPPASLSLGNPPENDASKSGNDANKPQPVPSRNPAQSIRALAATLLDLADIGFETSGHIERAVDRRQAHWLYGIVVDEFVKIGKAKSLSARLSGYQIGSPYPVKFDLTVPVYPDYYSRAEKLCHHALKANHHQGEWFRVTPELALAVMKEAASRVASHRAADVAEGRAEPERPTWAEYCERHGHQIEVKLVNGRLPYGQRRVIYRRPRLSK